MFPGGVLFDNEVDDYRTDNENEVFKIFRRISASYKEDKTEGDKQFSLLVAFCRNEATRTPDPYVPNVVRYQLRYIPNAIFSYLRLQRYVYFRNQPNK